MIDLIALSKTRNYKILKIQYKFKNKNLMKSLPAQLQDKYEF